MTALVNVLYGSHEEFEKAQHVIQNRQIPAIKAYKDVLWCCDARAQCLAIFSDAFGTINTPFLTPYKYYFNHIEKRIRHEIDALWAGEMHLGQALMLEVRGQTTTSYTHICYVPLKRKLTDTLNLKDVHFGLRSLFLQMTRLKLESLMIPYGNVLLFFTPKNTLGESSSPQNNKPHIPNFRSIDTQTDLVMIDTVNQSNETSNETKDGALKPNEERKLSKKERRKHKLESREESREESKKESREESKEETKPQMKKECFYEKDVIKKDVSKKIQRQVELFLILVEKSRCF